MAALRSPSHKPEIRVRTFPLMLLLSIATANATATTHYLDLVNTAQNSITSFAVAVAGSGQFRELPLGNTALHGGGDSATLAIVTGRDGDDADARGCVRDLRTEFSNGRVLIQKNFDVCKYRSYHTGQYLRGHAQTVVASVP